jgi:hypothetical protein
MYFVYLMFTEICTTMFCQLLFEYDVVNNLTLILSLITVWVIIIKW